MGRDLITTKLWILLPVILFSQGKTSASPDPNPASADYDQTPSAPQIILHPENTYFGRGEPGGLNCKASGYPRPNITWYQNGVLVNTSQDREAHRMILLDGSLFFLRFIHTKNSKPDVGMYYCNATNQYGTAISRNATLSIAMLKEDFRQEPVDTTVAVGTTAILHCQPPRGEPTPSIIWHHNGEVIHERDRFKKGSNNDLIITIVTKLDAGEYKCLAKNMAGEKSSSPAELMVLDVPEFHENPEDLTADEGQTVDFHCDVTGDPPLNVQWTKEDGALDSSRTRILEDHTLRIENVRANDEGRYICQATNKVGEAEAVATLKVESPPSFLIRPRDQVVAIGRTITLPCSATGSPKPTVFWKAGSQETLIFTNNAKGRVSVADDGSLRIEDVKKWDEGEYICQALNTKGEASASADITVIAEGEFPLPENDLRPPPIIRFGPQNLTLPLDSNALLRCQATGDPQPTIRWYKEDRPLKMVDPRFTQLSSGTLQISSLEMSDKGSYSCKASSVTGETVWTSHLNVAGQASSSSPFQYPTDISKLPISPSKPVVSDVRDTTLRLTWNRNINSAASSILGYRVEYFGYGTSLGWTLASDLVQGEEFMVENLHPNTSYVFMVRAVNSKGIGSPSDLSDRIRTLERGSWKSFIPHNTDLTDTEIKDKLRGVTVRLDILPINSTAMQAEWSVDNDQGILDGYVIQYQHIPDITKKPMEYGRTWKKPVPYLPTRYVITGLETYQWYEICVMGSSRKFLTSCSNHVKSLTEESVPSGPPRDVTVEKESDTELRITWAEPSRNQRNGMILGYKVRCFSETGGHNCSVETDEQTFGVVIRDVSPDADYKISVAAYTAKGLGPWSKEQVVGPVDITKQPWFMGVLIGTIGGTLWLIICIFSIWLCRKRRARKKLKEHWYTAAATGSQKTTERNGNVLRNGYSMKDANFQGTNTSADMGLPPEFTNLLQNKKEGETTEDSIYNMARECNLPELKTFYQRTSPVTPYATTTLLQAQNAARQQQQRPSDQVFQPINKGYIQHSSGSGDSNTDHSNTGGPRNQSDPMQNPTSDSGSHTTDENGCLIKQARKSSRSGAPQSPAVVNWNDVLPPPPEHPPPCDMDSNKGDNYSQYSAVRGENSGPPMSPHSVCSCPVSHPQGQGHGYNKPVYSDNECTKCQSLKYFDSRPYSPQQFIPQRTQSSRQQPLQNMPRTLGYPPNHSQSPRSSPAILHGYSQPWDCTHLPHMQYDYAQPPGEYTQPLQGEFIDYSQPPRGTPVEVKNRYNRTQSEPNQSSLPYFPAYKIVPPQGSVYRGQGERSTNGRPGYPEVGGAMAEEEELGVVRQMSLPSYNECVDHPGVYSVRDEPRMDNRHISMEIEGYSRNADSFILEDPDYAVDSDVDPNKNERDSMVANWEETTDNTDGSSCSPSTSSSGGEDGEFLTEEDFASAVAKAAEMSGLTVVGTTVSDPNAKQHKKQRRPRRAARPPSPGYSTDSNYGTGELVHKPYPKSQRRKQIASQGVTSSHNKDSSGSPTSAETTNKDSSNTSNNQDGADTTNNQDSAGEKPTVPLDELPAYSRPDFPSSPTSPGPTGSRPQREGTQDPHSARMTEDYNSSPRVAPFQFGEDIPVV